MIYMVLRRFINNQNHGLKENNLQDKFLSSQMPFNKVSFIIIVFNETNFASAYHFEVLGHPENFCVFEFNA